jgi:hypothetical protein
MSEDEVNAYLKYGNARRIFLNKIPEASHDLLRRAGGPYQTMKTYQYASPPETYYFYNYAADFFFFFFLRCIGYSCEEGRFPVFVFIHAAISNPYFLSYRGSFSSVSFCVQHIVGLH